LAHAPVGDASAALLRLEMASELTTPAEHLNARRALQLQLLTRRHDPPPAQTWGEDTALVLASSFDADQARRLQSVLKILLKPN
jgi:phage tail sheath gpL-like